MTGQRCATCFGPVRAAYQRCYKCEEHRWLAADLLADVVVPVAYATRGDRLAADLWQYKAPPPARAAQSARRLRGLLAGFLRDHRACVWAAAGMDRAPGLWAVVPSGRGRVGDHPLAALVEPYLRKPRVGLDAAAGQFGRGRDLDGGWVTVCEPADGIPVTGRDVLLIEDTWVTGGSAQSAAIALKRAGAGRIAIVVLGRHVQPGLAPPDLGQCVVHQRAKIASLSRIGSQAITFRSSFCL